MKHFFNRLRWELDALTPPGVARRVVGPAEAALLPLIRPVLYRWVLTGSNDAGPFSMDYIGRFRRSLVPFEKCFFSEPPVEQRSLGVPWWRVRDAAAASDCDLVLIEAEPRVARRLPRSRALTMPARVDLVLDLRGTWEEVEGRFRKTARKRLLAARRGDYGYRVSEDPQDFARFYHDMYLPTMRSRHGELALPLSEEEARAYFRRGFLFLLLRDGREVGAGLCHPRGRTLRLLCFGVGGEPELMRQDVVGALQALRIRWAHEQGYEALDFLSAEPCPGSGIFRYKRQWGTKVVAASRPDLRLWLWVRRPTAAALRCCEQNPLIVVDGAGALHGAVFLRDVEKLDERTRSQLRGSYATPGLRSLLACPLAGLAGDRHPLAQAVTI